MQHEGFGGFVPALPTPIRPDETIDEEGVENLVRYVLEKGAEGVFVLGTMGEFPKLLDSEKERLIRVSRELVKDDKQFFVGVSDASTKRAIANATKAQDLGADAVVALPPYFYSLDEPDAIYSFFIDLAGAVSVPVLIYCNPSMTKVPISLPILSRLSKHENISGLKYTEDDMKKFHDILRHVRSDEFSVFIANEHSFDEACLAGADGLVGGVACLIPDVVRDIYNSGLKGDNVGARMGQLKLDAILSFISNSWIHATKYALKLLGICDETPCKPYVPMSIDTRTAVESVLKELNLV